MCGTAPDVYKRQTIPCLFIAKVLNLQFDLDKLVYYTYSVDRVEDVYKRQIQYVR